MGTSLGENSVPGVVAFTPRGSAALEQLAEILVGQCDGSPTSIADVLRRVLDADIEDLAEALSATAQPAPALTQEVPELGPAPESPDEAARRRLSSGAPTGGGNPSVPSASVAR